MRTSLPRTLATTTLVLGAAIVVAAGCGGSSEGDPDEYQDRMRAVAADVQQANDAVVSLPADADVEARATAVRSQQEAIEAGVARARKVTPPDDVKDEHEELVAALADYAELLGRLGEAYGDPSAENEILAEVGPVFERASKASEELEEAGYEFRMS